MVYRLTPEQWTKILVLVALFFLHIRTKAIQKAPWYVPISKMLPVMDHPIVFVVIWTLAKLCLCISWFPYWDKLSEHSKWSNTVMSLFLVLLVLINLYPLTLHMFNLASLFLSALVLLTAFTLMDILWIHFVDVWYMAFLVMILLIISLLGFFLDVAVTFYRYQWEAERAFSEPFTKKPRNPYNQI